MTLTSVPTERTTAATDALLALLALGCALYLLRLVHRARWKVLVWTGICTLFGIAATLGVVVHGFEWDVATKRLLWLPLNLALGWTIALFVVSAVSDLWGEPLGRRSLPVMLGVGLVFLLVTLAQPGNFLVFVLYEAVAMLFALVVYVRLLLQGRSPGVAWTVAGILITVAAAAVQATRAVRFTLGWEFDHNGAFHLLQMPGLLALVVGVRRSLA